MHIYFKFVIVFKKLRFYNELIILFDISIINNLFKYYILWMSLILLFYIKNYYKFLQYYIPFMLYIWLNDKFTI